MKRLSIIITAIALLVAACSSSDAAEDTQALAPEVTSTTSTTTTSIPPSTTAPAQELSPLAELISPLGSAAYDPAEHQDTAPDPVSVSIPRLDIYQAPVDPVGVADNGDMEIPEAERIGWYEFGPEPGQDGSAVLAGHISYNGTPGVFRYLENTEVGDLVTVEFDDGTEQTFEIIERAQYNKVDLPLQRVFAKDGSPVLTLITCGGAFNSSLRSYEDNTVAYAVPVVQS